MSVTYLADHRPKTVDLETVAVLRYLERMASKGELRDLAVAFRVDDKDLHAFTGVFKSEATVAATAAEWLSIRLNAAADSARQRKAR